MRKKKTKAKNKLDNISCGSEEGYLKIN